MIVDIRSNRTLHLFHRQQDRLFVADQRLFEPSVLNVNVVSDAAKTQQIPANRGAKPITNTVGHHPIVELGGVIDETASNRQPRIQVGHGDAECGRFGPLIDVLRHARRDAGESGPRGRLD